MRKTYQNQNQYQRRTSPRTKKKRKGPARQGPGRANRTLPPAGHGPGAPEAAAHHPYVTHNRAVQAVVATANAVTVAVVRTATARTRSKVHRVGAKPTTEAARELVEANPHGRAHGQAADRTMVTVTAGATMGGKEQPKGAVLQKGLIHLARTAATTARDRSLGKLSGGASAGEHTRLEDIPTSQPAKSVTSVEGSTLTRIRWRTRQGHYY